MKVSTVRKMPIKTSNEKMISESTWERKVQYRKFQGSVKEDQHRQRYRPMRVRVSKGFTT